MATANGSAAPAAERRGPSATEASGAPSKRTRPCQRCQKLKVKCERTRDGGPCQRCQAKKRDCTFDEAPNKKCKKNSDERIDELEKTLAAMRESLAAAKQSTETHPAGEPAARFGSTYAQPLDMLARTAASAHSPNLDRFALGNTMAPASGTNPHTPNPRTSVSDSSSAWTPDGNSIDPIERRWLDIEDARALFDRFWTKMLPAMPVISFGNEPPDFELLRRQEPVFFLSILAAAAGNMTLDNTFEKLQTEALSVIMHRAVVKGEKRSELLSSLLILTVWPLAPARFDQLSAYLQSHMITGMAIDLGLQRSSEELSRNLSTKLLPEEVEPGNRTENFTRPLEKERTWLAAYLLSVGFGIGLRRPQTLDWQAHHATCLQAFLATGERNDLRLARIVQLLQISQDISKIFSYDTQAKKLSDPAVYLTLKGFRNQIDRWKKENQDLDEYENFWYHATVVHLNEVALHSFHDPGDLRPPFGLNVRVELPVTGSDYVVSTAHIDCISKVVHSAQKLLDVIFSLHFRDDGISLISNLPIVFFARSLYAWVTLVRVAAIGSSVYDESALRVNEYLEKLTLVFDESASIAHFHTAMKFSWVLRILKHSFKHKRGMPPIRPEPFTVASYQPIKYPQSALGDTHSGTGIPTTLRPLEPEFATEMEFTPQLSSANGELSLGPDFDWDTAMLNIGNWFGGGFNNGIVDGQQFNWP